MHSETHKGYVPGRLTVNCQDDLTQKGRNRWLKYTGKGRLLETRKDNLSGHGYYIATKISKLRNECEASLSHCERNEIPFFPL